MTDILAELQVPGPTVTALTEPFWNAAEAGQLLIQRCTECGSAVFYPRAICPHCWSDALIWEDTSGVGRLKSFSQIWKPGHQGWIPATPYVVGLVELAEGPTMLSHILADGPDPQVGNEVIFSATKVGNRVLPFFKINQ